MKHTHSKTLVLSLLALLPCLALCGCDDTVKVDVHLTYDAAQDALVETEYGLADGFASVSYEPAYVGDAYADWEETVLYEVKGWSPEVLLTEEWGGIGSMLYALDSPLPTLREMNPDTIYVCSTGTTTSCLLTVDDLDTVTEAAYYFLTGEAIALPEDGDVSYSMKFHSDDYAGIYYNLVYIQRGEGEEREIFLYDRGEKRCVQIPDEVFYDWMYTDEVETVAEVSGEGLSGDGLSEGEEIVITFPDE